MPRPSLRPSESEVQRIKDLFIERELTPYARFRLKVILAWAAGATVRQVAVTPGLGTSGGKGRFTCNREKVRLIIKRYAALTLDEFAGEAEPRGRGRRPVDKEVDAAIVATLRREFAAGRTISYRALHKEHGVSFNYVAKVARDHGLDPKHRKGRVSGTARTAATV